MKAEVESLKEKVKREQIEYEEKLRNLEKGEMSRSVRNGVAFTYQVVARGR